jgi:sugar phosphate isomerase/epimerase
VQYDPSNATVGRRRPIGLLTAVADRVVQHARQRPLPRRRPRRSPICAPPDGTSVLRQAPHGVTGKGLNDFDAIFTVLAANGYRGWVSIEDGMNGMGEMAESLAFLRSVTATHFP